MQNIIESITRKANRNIEAAQKDLDKFQTNFANNPTYAFEWSESAIKAAAKQDEWRRVKSALEKRPDPKALLKSLKAELARRASNPESSTSKTANITKRFALAELAGVIETLEDMLEYLDQDKQDA